MPRGYAASVQYDVQGDTAPNGPCKKLLCNSYDMLEMSRVTAHITGHEVDECPLGPSNLRLSGLTHHPFLEQDVTIILHAEEMT